jgi:hypothetical protein
MVAGTENKEMLRFLIVREKTDRHVRMEEEVEKGCCYCEIRHMNHLKLYFNFNRSF